MVTSKSACLPHRRNHKTVLREKEDSLGTFSDLNSKGTMIKDYSQIMEESLRKKQPDNEIGCYIMVGGG